MDGLISGVVSSRIARNCFGRYPVAFGSVTAVGAMFGRGLGVTCRAQVDCPRLGGWTNQGERLPGCPTRAQGLQPRRDENQKRSLQKCNYGVPSYNRSSSVLQRERLCLSNPRCCNRPCQWSSRGCGDPLSMPNIGSTPISAPSKRHKRTSNYPTALPSNGAKFQQDLSRALSPIPPPLLGRTLRPLP